MKRKHVGGWEEQGKRFSTRRWDEEIFYRMMLKWRV